MKKISDITIDEIMYKNSQQLANSKVVWLTGSSVFISEVMKSVTAGLEARRKQEQRQEKIGEILNFSSE